MRVTHECSAIHASYACRREDLGRLRGAGCIQRRAAGSRGPSPTGISGGVIEVHAARSRNAGRPSCAASLGGGALREELDIVLGQLGIVRRHRLEARARLVPATEEHLVAELQGQGRRVADIRAVIALAHPPRARGDPALKTLLLGQRALRREELTIVVIEHGAECVDGVDALVMAAVATVPIVHRDAAGARIGITAIVLASHELSSYPCLPAGAGLTTGGSVPAGAGLTTGGSIPAGAGLTTRTAAAPITPIRGAPTVHDDEQAREHTA